MTRPGFQRRSVMWTRLSRALSLLLSARPISTTTTALQVRLTATLLAVMVPLAVAMVAASVVARRQAFGWLEYACAAGLAVLTFTAYRYGLAFRPTAAARVLAITNIVGGLSVGIIEHDPGRAISNVTFTVLGVLWASFLLSPRDTTVLACAAWVASLLLPVLNPDVGWRDAVLPSFFVLFASTLLVITSYLQQRHTTEMERRTRQLADGQHQLRVTMDSSLDAVITCGADGIVFDWNRQAEAMYGLPRDLAVGHDIGRLAFPPDERDEVHALIRDVCAVPGSTRRTELRSRHPDFSVFPIELSASGLRLHDRPACAIFLRDISERRHLQAELIQSDRLVSVGRLAAGVAHEINNPMTYVLANLQFAAEFFRTHREAFGDAAIEFDEVLADAVEGAERVHAIVKDLRAFSHDASEDRHPVDVGRVLDSAAQLAGNEIRHRARLVKSYADGVPPVLANESRLGQVFLNLVMNALQSLPRDRANHELRLCLRHEAGRVIAEVTDTGAGIAPEIRDRLFQPFVTTKKVGEGTGLGLYISRNIITALGGDIRIASVVGMGTTFSVWLPALAATEALPLAARAAPAQTLAIATTPPLDILIVDDDDAVVRALLRLLAAHRLVTATGGVEALHVCAGRPFDLVLCDVMMPGMTGVELAGHLTDRELVPEERIVFLTGGAFTSGEQAFLARHPQRRLEKPIDLARLNDVLIAAAARVRAESLATG